MKKIKAKISKIKGWFFEKISKIYKPVVRLIKKKGSGLKSIKLKMKKEKLQMIPLKYKGSLDYYKQLCVNKLDHMEEMDRFLQRYNLPTLNQEKIEYLNRSISSMKLKL